MSNQSLRERFGLPDEKENGVAISRLIRKCNENKLIKEEDLGFKETLQHPQLK